MTDMTTIAFSIVNGFVSGLMAFGALYTLVFVVLPLPPTVAVAILVFAAPFVGFVVLQAFDALRADMNPA